ncbi:MAG: hypothetical protein ACE5IY_15975 [bacterium]
MSKKRILVYDDNSVVAKGWADKLDRALTPLRDSFEVTHISVKAFESCIAELERRRKLARKQGEYTRQAIEFDKSDILVLDYDLLNPEAANEDVEYSISGEEVAYLARCYSHCRLIAGLNRFGQNTFDLTLKGHPESYADLNIGEDHVDNKGLWFDAPWHEFRPWYWPVLPHTLDAFEKRVDELKANGNLDKPILGFLEFPEEIVQILPRSSLEFISVPDRRPEETTFHEFVRATGNGLKRKDQPCDDDSVARIAAARIAKWLERLVLPGQDILVDAPHLLLRYPSLLKGDRNKPETWDAIVSITELDKLKPKIEDEKIEEFRFKKDNWLSRPAWFWHQVSNSDQIDEVRNPWATERPDLVFCEDISKFMQKSETQEFVAELPSPFVRRFVKIERAVSYKPGVRFSL